MPNIKSAVKHMRSDAKKHAQNVRVLSELKTLNKRLSSLTETPEEAKKVAARLVTRYDVAVTKGVIPRRRADRKKSRIAKLLTKLKTK